MIDLNKEKYRLPDLLRIVDVLRAPGGCPWDIMQTHDSIRRDFIEEVYEACEGIDRKDDALLREELGDVLLQVVFHAGIARDRNAFDFDAVCDGICRKLILRHPHVFADVNADTAEKVLENWDQIKRAEKDQRTHTDAMRQVARSLPALIFAEKIQSKARKAGFDWPDAGGALDKIDEELREVRDAVAGGIGTEEEIGDLLFAAVNAARLLKIDPEAALIKAADKFTGRFARMEEMAVTLDGMSLDDMDKLWNRVKSEE